MNSTSIMYIVFGAIVITFMLSPGNEVSDEAVRAVASTCEKVGQVAHVEMTHQGNKIFCVKPDAVQPAAK